MKRVLYFITCSLFAAALTGLLYLYDSQRSATYQTDELLRWARQVAAQAEGLALNAREREEADPMGWAVGHLTQGSEPRVMKVSKTTSTQLAQPGESFQFDRQKGVFDFVKIVTPEDGSGVRVQLFPEFVGFLGSHTPVTHDLAIVAVFLACWFLVSSFRSRGQRPAAKSADDIKPKLREWIGEAKGVLTQLGVHVREMTREAQNLAVAAAKSRTAMSGLRDGVHAGIRDVHAGRQSLRELSEMIQQAELMAPSDEVREFVQRMRAIAESAEEAVKQIELQLEPWATDADQAFHSYDDVFRASEGMTGHIRKATETMIGQAKLMQSLKGQVSDEAMTEKRAPKPVSNGKAMNEAFPEEAASVAPAARPTKPPRRRSTKKSA